VGSSDGFASEGKVAWQRRTLPPVHTQVDRQSIMMYLIDQSWTTNPAFVAGFNDDLSQTDQELIARVYSRDNS
jgi:hypothetical protein